MRLVSFAVDGTDRLGIEVEGRICDLSDHRQEFPDLVDLLNEDKRGRLAQLVTELEPRYRSEDVTFRPPVSAAAKIFCVGLNYVKRHPVTGEIAPRPPQPTIFVKTRDALAGHRQPIEYPTGISEQLDYEGELAVVIGRSGRHIRRADAPSHVAGYTILNDGSVRDWQKNSLFSGKNFYRASSCGPAIVTADTIRDPMRLTLVTRVNGEERQRASTDLMLFDVAEIISHISRFTPLSPGDVIATGSPDGSGGSLTPQHWLKPGDRIDIEVSGIGVLSNVVR